MANPSGTLPHELIQSLYICETSPTKLRWLFTVGSARKDSIAGSKRRYYTRRLIGWQRKQYDAQKVYEAVKQRDLDAKRSKLL